ncbi:nuclear transport factor 2 family protein [Streptomyces sp. ET3-23]|uniref:nuclear transport factor 2 family protein n=1 Tax=Streptomyces sp. ET3-23 TaxID=2885643 RepID=UPI001D100480|nr:nuclear transport factor 2 family protein [Streptomyces sp. ET3-23]MCC2279820.1 nuclear transport factor 2 family protein [Streptomyces sp. ET3-23]
MTDPLITDTAAVLTGMYRAEAEYLTAGGPGEAPFDPLASFFAPDVVLHQADALPYGGIWRGHAGLQKFFVAMSRTWASFAMEEQEFLTTGETAVVLTRIRARARASGRELAFPVLQTIRVEDGRISEVRPFYWDTAIIAEACAVPV